MALRNIPAALRKNYEVHEWRHASAVLRTDFPNEWNDIIAVLAGFRFSCVEPLAGQVCPSWTESFPCTYRDELVSILLIS